MYIVFTCIYVCIYRFICIYLYIYIRVYLFIVYHIMISYDVYCLCVLNIQSYVMTTRRIMMIGVATAI